MRPGLFQAGPHDAMSVSSSVTVSRVDTEGRAPLNNPQDIRFLGAGIYRNNQASIHI